MVACFPPSSVLALLFFFTCFFLHLHRYTHRYTSTSKHFFPFLLFFVLLFSIILLGRMFFLYSYFFHMIPWQARIFLLILILYF